MLVFGQWGAAVAFEYKITGRDVPFLVLQALSMKVAGEATWAEWTSTFSHPQAFPGERVVIVHLFQATMKITKKLHTICRIRRIHASLSERLNLCANAEVR